MKKYTSILTLLIFFTAFTACEKTELDGHCPAEGQNSQSFADPQDLRVNDDSDQEDAGPSTNKNLSATNNDFTLTESTLQGASANNNDTANEGGESNGLVNDDSDDEEEGRRPNSDSPQPKGQE